MEEHSTDDILCLLSTQYYIDFINNFKFYELQKFNQIIDYFNASSELLSKIKVNLSVSNEDFYLIGSYICQILSSQISITLKLAILQFYYALYENISQNYTLIIDDNSILECLFSHFFNSTHESIQKYKLKKRNIIEDSKTRIFAFKLCSKSINKDNINLIFNTSEHFNKIIYLFQEKSSFFFEFLVNPITLLKNKEDISNILNVSENMFETIEAYFDLLTNFDDFFLDDKITGESIERMKESVETMLTTILGDSINEIFDFPDYTNQIKNNLYKIIFLILKFSILLTKEEHISLFKESFENFTRILLKLCLIEGIPSPCFDISYFNDYRSKLIYMKSILLSLQPKFSFLLLTEHIHVCEESEENEENDILMSFNKLEI